MDCALGHLHNISFSIGKQTGLKHGEINTLFATQQLYKQVLGKATKHIIL